MLITRLLKCGKVRHVPFGKTNKVHGRLVEYQDKTSNVPTKMRNKIRKRN